jgi:HD-like signal output (HDOD) protein
MLIRLASDNDVDFAELESELTSHPGIAGLVQRAANAVSMGTVHEVRSLRHALAILGLERVRAILFQLREDVTNSRAATPPADLPKHADSLD